MDHKNILSELRRGNPDVDRYMGKENLMLLHENFWAADLPIRAVIINKLLNAGYPEDKDKINMILDMFFDKNSEYIIYINNKIGFFVNFKFTSYLSS